MKDIENTLCDRSFLITAGWYWMPSSAESPRAPTPAAAAVFWAGPAAAVPPALVLRALSLLGVNYKLTPDKLIYAKYSTGYISGGALSAIIYNPEIAKSLEGGIKADWLNGSLRTNLAVFQTKYTDLQASVSGVLLGRPEITNSLGNVGDAKVKGVELETSYSPVRNLGCKACMGPKIRYINPRPHQQK